MFSHRFIDEYLFLLGYCDALDYSINRWNYPNIQILREREIAYGRLLELRKQLKEYYYRWC